MLRIHVSKNKQILKVQIIIGNYVTDNKLREKFEVIGKISLVRKV